MFAFNFLQGLFQPQPTEFELMKTQLDDLQRQLENVEQQVLEELEELHRSGEIPPNAKERADGFLQQIKEISGRIKEVQHRREQKERYYEEEWL